MVCFVLFYCFFVATVQIRSQNDNFNSEFQRFDGWYNNINHLDYGSSESSLIYIAGSAYSDGMWEPGGLGRPSPGLISLKLLREADESLAPSRNLTAFFAFFGQVVSGEIVATVASGNVACPVEMMPIPIYRPSACDNSTGQCENTEEVRKMPFFRVDYDHSTGQQLNNPRRPKNFATTWIDGSFVYSHSTPWAQSLRTFKGGRLKELNISQASSRNPDRVPILNPPPPALHPTLLNPERLFLLGSQKSNQHPPLLVIGMIWHRYHNWLADFLARAHPTWKEEKLFQRTRRYFIAVMQNVMMYEFVTQFVGRGLPEYTGYDSRVDPSVSVEFQAAAYRFGHSLIPSGFYVRNQECQFTPVAFCKVWWDGSSVIDAYGIDDIVRGLVSQKMENGDHIFSDGVREKLFGIMRMTQGDLAAANIMRGREEGLADYNTVRKAFGLDPIAEWKDINPGLFEREPELLEKASNLYNNSMDNVDLYVAGLLETQGGFPGETFQRILLDQFTRIRDADRFWFENEKNGFFDAEEMAWIKSVRMRDVIVNVTGIRPEEMPSGAFLFDPKMPCPQPTQITSALLGECPEAMSYDFFTGSEIAFVASFVSLGAFPFFVAMVAWCIAKRRSRMYKIQNTYTSFRSTKRMKNTYIANEYVSPKEQKKVQIKLGPGAKLQVMSRRAECMRAISIMANYLEVWISKNSDEDPLFVLHVPKEYDLILIFGDLEYRAEFLSSFGSFAQKSSSHLEVVELSYEDILHRVVTQADRQGKLEYFFRSAFRQAFRVNKKSGGASQTLNRTLSNIPGFLSSFRHSSNKPTEHPSDLLTMGLNKAEFAQALKLTPDSTFVLQMFQLADKDRSGYISYAEFLEVLALLSKGTLEDKMRVLFDMYDMDGSNDLDPYEFSTMIKSLMDVANHNVPEEQMDNMVQGMFRDCGIENKDRIEFQDFYHFVESHQSLLWNDVTMKSLGLTENEKTIADTTRVVSPVIKCSKELKIVQEYRRMIMYMENNWNKILVLTVFVLVCGLLFTEYFMLYYYFREEVGIRKAVGYSISVSRGSAHALSFSYALLFLTVSRNVMTYLRDTVIGYYIPVDSAIDFHRFVALFSVFLTVIHIIGHGINFYEISTQSLPILKCLVPDIHMDTDFLPKFHFWLFQTVPGITGVLLVMILSVMLVFSTHWARQHIFVAFWTTHRLYIFVYLLTVLHGSYGLLQKPVFPFYIMGPMIVFIIDWIIALRQKHLVLKIQDAAALPSSVLYLCFKLPRSLRFASGQWVRLACEELSPREFHPFTITSAPHEQHLSVHIRAVGPWTEKLYGLFKEKIANREPFPKILLQGPFGSIHQDWFKFEVVVMVGAGIGVTPTAAVLKDLVQKVYQLNNEIPCKRVYFVWLARTHQQFEWFVDILREVERRDVHNLIQIDIFVTQLLKDFDIRTTMLYICEHQFQRLSNKSLFTGLRAKTHFGRIDFEQYLRSVQRRNHTVGKVGVFSCGPKSAIRAADAACQKINQSGGSPIFIAHAEVF